MKCQPEMINNYCSVCIGMAQLNDEGVPTACECDTSGVLTSYMLSLLADEPAYMGDTADLSFERQMLTLANCGAMTMRLARPDEPVQLTQQYDYMGPATGVCTTYQCRAGSITLARINRAQGRVFHDAHPGRGGQPARQRARTSVRRAGRTPSSSCRATRRLWSTTMLGNHSILRTGTSSPR